MEYFAALNIAKQVLLILEPYCERIEIAGSIRRGKPEVHDIELVAKPKTKALVDLFGEKCGETSLLNNRELMEPLGEIKKSGPKFTQIALREGVMLDLFMVTPPADWAVLYAIRTGPAEFSRWIVTNRSYGGALHNGYKCEDGRIISNGGTNEHYFYREARFLDWLGIGWIKPADRLPKWNFFSRAYHA